MKPSLLMSLLLFSPGLFNDAHAEGGIPLHFIGARPLGRGDRGVIVRYDHLKKDRLFQNGERVENNTGEAVIENAVHFIFVNEFTPQFITFVSLPLMARHSENTPSGVQTVTNRGLGDTKLVGLFQLSKQELSWRTTLLSGLVALKLPTGRTGKRNDRDILLSPSNQLGTGSFDVSVGGAYKTVFSRATLHLQGVYTLNTVGAQEYKAGNGFDYDGALGVRILPFPTRQRAEKKLVLLGELNGRSRSKSKQLGIDLNNSGGHTITGSVDLQFFPKNFLILDLSYRVPLIQKLNGEQLGMTRGFSGGLRYFNW